MCAYIYIYMYVRMYTYTYAFKNTEEYTRVRCDADLKRIAKVKYRNTFTARFSFKILVYLSLRFAFQKLKVASLCTHKFAISHCWLPS